MKKRLGIILAAAVAASGVCFGLTACGESVEEQVHHYKKTVIAPTCTEEGYTLYECTDVGCDNKYTEDRVDALGHSYADNFCVRCDEFDKVGTEYTAGLEYAPVYDKTGKIVEGYAVVGLGDASIGNYVKLEEFHEETINGEKVSRQVIKIEDGVFENLTSVREVLLSNGVKEIGESAFLGCTALKNIALPTTLNYVGPGVFKGCTSLKDISLPTSVKIIESSAFEGCTALKSMSLPYAAGAYAKDENGDTKLDELKNPIIDYKHFGYLFGAQTYEQNTDKIPASLKSVDITGSLKIAENAFNGSGIESVNIGGSVGVISRGAFKNCSLLKDAAPGLGIYSIGEEAFYGCAAMTEMTIPDSTAEIGSAALGGCDSLVSISLPYACGGIAQGYKHFGYLFGGETYEQNATSVPASLKSLTVTGQRQIVDNAFYGCKFESVKVVGSVETVGASAFRNCTALKTAVLETGLKRIGENAFNGCVALDEFTFGKGVKNIGANAFYSCDSLGTVHFNGTLAEFGVTKYADKYSSPLAYGADLHAGGEIFTADKYA